MVLVTDGTISMPEYVMALLASASVVLLHQWDRLKDPPSMSMFLTQSRLSFLISHCPSLSRSTVLTYVWSYSIQTPSFLKLPFPSHLILLSLSSYLSLPSSSFVPWLLCCRPNQIGKQNKEHTVIQILLAIVAYLSCLMKTKCNDQ